MGRAHRVGGMYSAAAILVPSYLLYFYFPPSRQPHFSMGIYCPGGRAGGYEDHSGGRVEGMDDNNFNYYLSYPITSKGEGSFVHTSGERQLCVRLNWKGDYFSPHLFSLLSPIHLGRCCFSILSTLDEKEIPPTLGANGGGKTVFINSYITPPRKIYFLGKTLWGLIIVSS